MATKKPKRPPLTHDELARLVDKNPSGRCEPVLTLDDLLHPLAGPNKPKRRPSRPYEEIP